VHAGVGRAADVVVAGGGFAGLAAATALAEAGAAVVVLEGRPHLGGRARSWTDPETGASVDNGQHLFMGCYRETRAFLSRIGTHEDLVLQPRLLMPLVDEGGRVGFFRLSALPFPWGLISGLLRFPGLDISGRIGLLRVAREVRRRSRPGSQDSADALDGQSVAGWLRDLGQSQEACRRLWQPLAVSALNEEPERASAAMFFPVLREAFLGGPEGSRLGLSRVGLSDLYAEPAARYLKARGSVIHLRTQVRRILLDGERCAGVVLADGRPLAARAVVAAVPAEDLLEILPPGLAGDPFFAGVARLETSPIVSVYLWFGAPVTDLPFAGLVGGTWQWLFNREMIALPGGPPRAGGSHAVTLVCSAARDLVGRSREALVRSALETLHLYVPGSRQVGLRHALVIKEKRATLSPRVGGMRSRPPFRTPVPGLHLAGDWTATGLPATIEGAVLSGHACARQVIDERGP
jgi:squalene-associated FAD-dependent desaturase